jgi:hypothetical protein
MPAGVAWSGNINNYSLHFVTRVYRHCRELLVYLHRVNCRFMNNVGADIINFNVLRLHMPNFKLKCPKLYLHQFYMDEELIYLPVREEYNTEDVREQIWKNSSAEIIFLYESFRRLFLENLISNKKTWVEFGRMGHITCQDVSWRNLGTNPGPC